MTSMTGFLQAFPPFDHEGDTFTVGTRLEQWLEGFVVFLVAMNVKDNARKCAILLFYVVELNMQSVKHCQIGEMTRTLRRWGSAVWMIISKLPKYR